MAKKSDIPSIPSVPSVIDNLTSSSTTAALSANQGRVLNQKISSSSGVRLVGTYSAGTLPRSIFNTNHFYICYSYGTASLGSARVYYVRVSDTNTVHRTSMIIGGSKINGTFVSGYFTVVFTGSVYNVSTVRINPWDGGDPAQYAEISTDLVVSDTTKVFEF